MGLMNTIRKNPIILLVSIGLAMAGFILMDMMTSGGPASANQFTLGKVNGQRIDWEIFSDTEARLFGNSGADVYQRKQQLWDYFVEKILIDDIAEDLGLGVGKEELIDLEFGTNLSPIIQRNFMDPNTRQVDRQQLNSLRQAIDGDQLPADLRVFWAEQEKEIIKDRLQAKLVAMVSKGMYLPTWQAEMLNKDRATQSEVAYVRIPFDVVADSDVTFTDDELSAYLKQHKAKFYQHEETRSISFVSFDVKPTSEDSAALYKDLAALVAPFQEADNDTLFVENNYGFMDDAYYQDDFFTSPEADTLFSMSAGSVYGPFVENGQYLVVKIQDRMIVPDSVKSRHILIQAKDPAAIEQAQTTIDSLKGLVEAGTVSFDTLALQYGQDATRTSGGDLGFTGQGQMVKPFNDLIFYKATPGKYYTVTTQFGVHLVQVTDRKFVENKVGLKMAILNEAIIPSEATQKRAYQKALEAVSKFRDMASLEQAATENKDLVIETSSPFRANDFSMGILGQGSSIRDIIRWAFKQKEVGGISPEVYAFEDEQAGYTNKYLVTGLANIRPEGDATLESARAELEVLVRNQAKGKKIAEQIGSQTDLDALAAKYSSVVDTAKTMSFASSYLTGIGNEPKLIGTVVTLQTGSTSAPIIGQNGVYVAKVLNRPSEVPPANVALIRQSLKMQKSSSMSYRFVEALKKDAKMEDNRSNFF